MTHARLIRPLDIAQSDAEIIVRTVQQQENEVEMARKEQERLAFEATDYAGTIPAPPTPNQLWLLRPASQKNQHPNPAQLAAEQQLRTNQTLEELLPFRVKTTYRIVREIARQYGLIADDEMLSDIDEKAWQRPLKWITNDVACKAMSDTLKAVLLTATAQRVDLCIDPPPPDPLCFSGELTDPDSYDPNNDMRLGIWLQMYEIVATQLNVEQGTSIDPLSGYYGLAGILDANLARDAWPGRLMLLAWEQMFIEEVVQFTVDKGLPETRRELTRLYGLQPHETTGIIKAAKHYARTFTDGDLEEDRAMMILRLEDAFKRAKDALDTKTEVAILKQLAIVQGLSKADPEDLLSDFSSMSKKVSNEASNGHAGSRPLNSVLGTEGSVTPILEHYGDNE